MQTTVCLVAPPTPRHNNRLCSKLCYLWEAGIMSCLDRSPADTQWNLMLLAVTYACVPRAKPITCWGGGIGRDVGREGEYHTTLSHQEQLQTY